MGKENRRWSEDEIKELRSLRDFGFTIREIADRMGRTYDSIFKKLKAEKITYQFPNNFRRGVRSTKKFKMPSIEELMDFQIKANELMRAFDIRNREVFTEIITRKWLGIVWMGDWHFDHYKTDLRTLEKELSEIGEEQDVVVIHVGDSGDWSDVRFTGLNMPSIHLPQHLRYKLLWHLISKIPNILAICDGCHDDWEKNRKFDVINHIMEKKNELGHPTAYMGYGGFLNFKVGKYLYRICAYHRLPGESMYNIFHPNLRALRELDSTCDIVTCGHRHDKVGISYQYYQHKPRVLVRTGSHQYLTDYAWKYGFGGAIAKSPMTLLNGSEKRMLAFPNYKEGLEELRRLNKG